MVEKKWLFTQGVGGRVLLVDNCTLIKMGRNSAGWDGSDTGFVIHYENETPFCDNKGWWSTTGCWDWPSSDVDVEPRPSVFTIVLIALVHPSRHYKMK